MKTKKYIKVEVGKITIGRDDQVYIAVHHQRSKNWPCLVFNKSDLYRIDKEINGYEEKD